jgi:hypothetical protein
MHWSMAARWNLLTYQQFIELEGTEQSRLVAKYETAMMVEAVATRQAQKEANWKGRKGRR